MAIQIKTDIFNPFQEIQAYQNTKLVDVMTIGASNIFIGTMRDFNEDTAVKSMTLEYYPSMTEKQIEKIIVLDTSKHFIEKC